MNNLIYNNEDYNHHFTKNVHSDAIRLFNRIVLLGTKNNFIPDDNNLMYYFHWTKDHLNRCFQMLKEMGVLTYVRNHRRTTLEFLGEYKHLNKCSMLNTIKKRG